MADKNNKVEKKEYNNDWQRLFLEIMLGNPEMYVRVQNIYNPENFSRANKAAATFIREHASQFGTMPTFEQVNAVASVSLTPATGLTQEHYDWFLTEFEGFCKQQELTRAIVKASDMLDAGNYGPVEKLIKDAVQIGLMKDIGTDYFADPRARLMAIRANNGQVSTGWPALDKALFGGFNRGELNIFAGGSGSGKSLFMQNLAINWVTAGLNGVYLTLELSEELCSMRMDSMVANISTREIFKNLDDVELKIRMSGKKSGKLQVKYLPAQSTINDIRAFLKEYQIRTGIKIDFLAVDYLDLLMPVSAKVSPNDLFVKDKYVSEELRNFAKELGIIFVTASQLNRGAVDEVEFDHSHISGGISKINTADNVFGIFTSRAMRERGRYQLQLMKTRSSSGVGTKIELEFNIECLRITDAGEDSNVSSSPGVSAENILSSIKNKTTVKSEEPAKKVLGEAQSKDLKALLANLKKSNE